MSAQLQELSPLNLLHIGGLLLMAIVNAVSGVGGLLEMCTDMDPLMRYIARHDFSLALHAFLSIAAAIINLSTVVLIYDIRLATRSLHFQLLPLLETKVKSVFISFLLFNFIYVAVWIVKIFSLQLYLRYPKNTYFYMEIHRAIVDTFECCPDVFRNVSDITTFCKLAQVVPCQQEVVLKILLPIYISYFIYIIIFLTTAILFLLNQSIMLDRFGKIKNKSKFSILKLLFTNVDYDDQMKQYGYDAFKDPNATKTLRQYKLNLQDQEAMEAYKHVTSLFHNCSFDSQHAPSVTTPILSGSNGKYLSPQSNFVGNRKSNRLD